MVLPSEHPAHGAPIYKIGAALLHPSLPQVLLVRPLPKHPGETPPLVLPRGSRQYQGLDGLWHDARDAETATLYAADLEPLTRALFREVEEEAGLPETQSSQLQIEDMGALPFASRSKGDYLIHWFLLRLDASAYAAMCTPVDASETRWVDAATATAMAESGEMSPGYLPILLQALA